MEFPQSPSTSQRHANTVSLKPDLQQSFHFPNTFLQLPPSQNPVINFLTPARDLKDSFQGVTVPQPMPKIVAQIPQLKYSSNQNLTSYPTFPNPPPNSYVIAIHKYYHKNVSVCYGCSGHFRENGYPIPPNDMIVVSKTQRHYTDLKTHQKAILTDFSNVYYHSHQVCLSRHNVLFTPQLLMLLPDIKCGTHRKITAENRVLRPLRVLGSGSRFSGMPINITLSNIEAYYASSEV